MSEEETEIQEEEQSPDQPKLEGGAYEIIRSRLNSRASDLRDRLDQLNTARKEVFGAIPTALIATERVTTANNCVPRDMVAIGGGDFLFAYNVQFGLKNEIDVSDVLGGYTFNREDRTFAETDLPFLKDDIFVNDFKQLYKYYKKTIFAKFSWIGPHLFMVFRIGDSVTDIKTFKWLKRGDEMIYEGNRSDHEFVYPTQHEFEWKRTHRDLHRSGLHPHISIENRVYVETVGGDLTIKVEDNTESGHGIYSEPVEQEDQTLDDAEIFYASLGNLILLKIRPYQENEWRHFVYNEKLQQVRRIDAMEESCILLPDDQGIIFSTGYYLQLGEYKEFPSELSNMMFERRIQAPNGEDFLYVFYNRKSGTYVLMSYNIIEQRVESPITCNGFSTFANGELAYFKAQDDPQKHHVIQIWQTPYVDGDLPITEKSDSKLFKIGNPSIVRCMAECQEILTLLGKEDSYAGLYIDLVKDSASVVDAYFWIGDEETFDLKTPLVSIKEAAASAIDEFDKVTRLKKNAVQELQRIGGEAEKLITEASFGQISDINEFVNRLSGLRTIRGELISLKDVRYMDVPAVDSLEERVAEVTESLSQKCVEYLLKPEALDPYKAKVDGHSGDVEKLTKVTEAKPLAEQIAATASELEMLIEIVSNLKIEDATQTTRIIDSISEIYAPLNQIKAALKRRKLDLQKTEGAAQFAAQLRLLDQSVVNFLEISDTPEKCEEYLNKVMIQIEELEGRFSDFDDYVLQLSEKRDELYTAFENRKLALFEARNRRASTLFSSAERILKGIKHRVENLGSINDINGYYASDLMVDKVRDIITQLEEIDDSVKAGDIQSQLKTIREDAVRQLKDRSDLFVDGKNIIQFGKHKFSVNTQELELSIVLKDDEMYFHLAGTGFFEKIEDSEFIATRGVWNQEVPSETPEVYRAEYLAWSLLNDAEAGLELKDAESDSPALHIRDLATKSDEELLKVVQAYMAPRYAEGYVKGVHDHDASSILRELVNMHGSIGLLRFHTQARACASVFWKTCDDEIIQAKLQSFSVRNQLFPGQPTQEEYIAELQSLIRDFCEQTKLFPSHLADEAGEYLFYDLTKEPGRKHLVVSPQAAALHKAFDLHLKTKHFAKKLEDARKVISSNTIAEFSLLRDWLTAFLNQYKPDEGHPALDAAYIDEACAILLRGLLDHLDIINASVETKIEKLSGNHARMEDGSLLLNYNELMSRLQEHQRENVPLFHRYHELKSHLIETKRKDLRLHEFEPRVLSSFVRNQLINEVYLPIVGDNLAKQMGVVGEDTRTDRMGLLLLISPPGYGKTTLMEYIANRLGLIFMKVNGPAIGHSVTSLDPSEAPNASAREEMEKLNLALEMGDNVMLYLDDIQHTHPELLQKFISLCDAQRKIEGVYKGEAKTYDLRGRKVSVVMAGNPYTESGDKFQIPDMLANRADTYNLGDIIGDTRTAFETSYLENSLTSNPVLSKLSSRSQKDVYAIIKIAERGSRENVDFEGSYSPEEINEMVDVMKKLMKVRDTVLRVNLEYIASAAQAEEYRTEPPFKMQGSYRNMNRMAEKILPIMNDAEVEALINDHYKNEAQTLTTGAESNLLKFQEIRGTLAGEDADRWVEIKKTFKKNLLLQGADGNDPVSRVVAQLATFTAGLDAIQTTIAAVSKEKNAPESSPELIQAVEEISSVGGALQSIENAIRQALENTPKESAPSIDLTPLSNHLNTFGKSLDGIQKALHTNADESSSKGELRVIDEANEVSDYQIANISRSTLKRIWEIIATEREREAKKKGTVPPELPPEKSE